MATRVSTVSGDAEPARNVELIFLGTGTSSSLPQIECLTAPPDGKQCRTCLSTLLPEGKKNIRRNTSAVLRVDDNAGVRRTIVIDVGKNFQAAALEWFPKYGLRRIDAVLITHAHADAMNGLDDLRGWTLNGNIQSHIDIYLSKHTYSEVKRAFPYLVSREFASGGGDVPEFKYHFFEDEAPFEICDTGITITPFPVHHGKFFGTPPPPPTFLPTPQYSEPASPASGRTTPQIPSHLPHAISDRFKGDSLAVSSPTPPPQPFICHGFILQNSIVYMSDVSHVPEATWSLLQQQPGNPWPVFVVDCLRLNPHTSHFGLREAASAVKRLQARRNYFTGFGHEVSHDEYIEILRTLEDRPQREAAAQHPDKTENVLRGFDLAEASDEDHLWARPAFDGLRVRIDSEGAVTDDEY